MKIGVPVQLLINLKSLFLPLMKLQMKIIMKKIMRKMKMTMKVRTKKSFYSH